MFAFGWSSCGRKPEYPEETHLSDLVTTCPLYIHNIHIIYDIYIAWHLVVIKRILLHVIVSSVNYVQIEKHC